MHRKTEPSVDAPEPDETRRVGKRDLTGPSDAACQLAVVSSLYRYPLKGFGGQKMSVATLKPGKGIAFDRRFGITNGTRGVPNDGNWLSSRGFVRLLKNPQLPRHRMIFDDGPAPRLTIESATDGQAGGTGDVLRSAKALTVDLSDPVDIQTANETLNIWFGGGTAGPARLITAASGSGYWDHADATISLINQATVDELSSGAGVWLDPLRFRANIYLSGLAAWDEFALIGRRIRLGEEGVELEVLRPIDRCAATSVDPDQGGADINVPLLLSRRHGHIFCGVYARVIRGGQIRPGDAVVDVEASASALETGSAAPTAPQVADWPRFGTIIDRLSESASVVSLWIDDPLQQVTRLPPPKPGQHIRLHQISSGIPGWRDYTISGVSKAGRLRVSIKREMTPPGTSLPPGIMSNYLHDGIEIGDPILISGPFGEFRLPESEQSRAEQLAAGGGTGALVFASAGIGITPIIAMVRYLAKQRKRAEVQPEIYILHVARCGSELALWTELTALVDDRLPWVKPKLYLTRPDQGDIQLHHALRGRPTVEDAFGGFLGDEHHAEFYLCGPEEFMRETMTGLLERDVPASQIHTETFVSPGVYDQANARLMKPPLAGPFQVSFARSGITSSWNAGDGSLLDVGEGVGLPLPSSCRGGACRRCLHSLVEGSVVHLIEPTMPLQPHEALLCVAAPTSDVVIDA